MENSNNFIYPHIEQSMYTNFSSLPPLPMMPNYAQSSEQIEQSLQKSKKFKSGTIETIYPTHSKSTESTNSSISSLKSINNATKRMVIFDWDDTLFPTTEFIKKSKPMSIENLYKWGSRVFELLKLYIDTFGAQNVYIITNGDKGWIEYSLQMASKQFQILNNCRSPFKPCLLDYFISIKSLLQVYRIKTISARSLYQDEYPKQSKTWKEYTFIDQAFNHFYEENKGIILSIGDSFDEWIASNDCIEFMNNYLDKEESNFCLQRIKLQRTPSLDQLMKQWRTLILIAHDLNLQTSSFDHELLNNVTNV